MEDRPVVGALFRELHEITDVIRGHIGAQIDDERAGAGVNDRLLVGHLLDGERRLEEGRRLRGLSLD